MDDVIVEDAPLVPLIDLSNDDDDLYGDGFSHHQPTSISDRRRINRDSTTSHTRSSFSPLSERGEAVRPRQGVRRLVVTTLLLLDSDSDYDDVEWCDGPEQSVTPEGGSSAKQDEGTTREAGGLSTGLAHMEAVTAGTGIVKDSGNTDGRFPFSSVLNSRRKRTEEEIQRPAVHKEHSESNPCDERLPPQDPGLVNISASSSMAGSDAAHEDQHPRASVEFFIPEVNKVTEQGWVEEEEQEEQGEGGGESNGVEEDIDLQSDTLELVKREWDSRPPAFIGTDHQNVLGQKIKLQEFAVCDNGPTPQKHPKMTCGGISSQTGADKNMVNLQEKAATVKLSQMYQKMMQPVKPVLLVQSSQSGITRILKSDSQPQRTDHGKTRLPEGDLNLLQQVRKQDLRGTVYTPARIDGSAERPQSHMATDVDGHSTGDSWMLSAGCLTADLSHSGESSENTQPVMRGNASQFSQNTSTHTSKQSGSHYGWTGDDNDDDDNDDGDEFSRNTSSATDKQSHSQFQWDNGGDGDVGDGDISSRHGRRRKLHISQSSRDTSSSADKRSQFSFQRKDDDIDYDDIDIDNSENKRSSGNQPPESEPAEGEVHSAVSQTWILQPGQSGGDLPTAQSSGALCSSSEQDTEKRPAATQTTQRVVQSDSRTGTCAAQFPKAKGFLVLYDEIFKDHLTRQRPSSELLFYLQNFQDERVLVCKHCQQGSIKEPMVFMWGTTPVRLYNMCGVLMVMLSELVRQNLMVYAISSHPLMASKKFPAVWSVPKLKGRTKEQAVSLMYVLLIMEDILYHKEHCKNKLKKKTEERLHKFLKDPITIAQKECIKTGLFVKSATPCSSVLPRVEQLVSHQYQPDCHLIMCLKRLMVQPDFRHPFQRSMQLLYPPCPCQNMPFRDKEEQQWWRKVEQPQTQEKELDNLGLLRFLGYNIFCFLEPTALYVSTLELERRDLLPHNYHSVLTSSFLKYLLSTSDARLIKFIEWAFLSQFFSQSENSVKNERERYVFTPHALRLIYQKLVRRQYKYQQHINGIYYMMSLGHHCAWSLQVTPPTTQFHRVPGYPHPDGDYQPAAMIIPDSLTSLTQSVNEQDLVLKPTYYDGGGGTAPELKHVDESLNKALKTTISNFMLEGIAEPFCECELLATQRHKYKFLQFDGVELAHVTSMLFVGHLLHCWKRPDGLYVSLAELQCKALPIEDCHKLPCCYMLDLEKIFLTMLPWHSVRESNIFRLVDIGALHGLYQNTCKDSALRSCGFKFRIKLWKHVCPLEETPLWAQLRCEQPASTSQEGDPATSSERWEVSSEDEEQVDYDYVAFSKKVVASRQHRIVSESEPSSNGGSGSGGDSPDSELRMVDGPSCMPVNWQVQCHSVESALIAPSLQPDSMGRVHTTDSARPCSRRRSQGTSLCQPSISESDAKLQVCREVRVNLGQRVLVEPGQRVLVSVGQSVVISGNPQPQFTSGQTEVVASVGENEEISSFFQLPVQDSAPTPASSAIVVQLPVQDSAPTPASSAIVVQLPVQDSVPTLASSAIVVQLPVQDSAPTPASSAMVVYKKEGSLTVPQLMNTQMQCTEADDEPNEDMQFLAACQCPERMQGAIPSYSFLQCILGTGPALICALEQAGQAVVGDRLVLCFYRDSRVFFSMLDLYGAGLLQDINLENILRQDSGIVLENMAPCELQLVRECCRQSSPSTQQTEDNLQPWADLQISSCYLRQLLGWQRDRQVYLHKVGHICPQAGSAVHRVQNTNSNIHHVQSAWMTAFLWWQNMEQQLTALRSVPHRSCSGGCGSISSMVPAGSSMGGDAADTWDSCLNTCVVFVRSVGEASTTPLFLDKQDSSYFSLIPVQWKDVKEEPEGDMKMQKCHNMLTCQSSGQNLCTFQENADAGPQIAHCFTLSTDSSHQNSGMISQSTYVSDNDQLFAKNDELESRIRKEPVEIQIKKEPVVLSSVNPEQYDPSEHSASVEEFNHLKDTAEPQQDHVSIKDEPVLVKKESCNCDTHDPEASSDCNKSFVHSTATHEPVDEQSSRLCCVTVTYSGTSGSQACDRHKGIPRVCEIARPCEESTVKSIAKSDIVEGLVLDMLCGRVQLLDDCKAAEWLVGEQVRKLLGLNPSTAHLVLMGMLTTNDCCYTCLGIEGRLYVNWAEVVQDLSPEDQTLLFMQAQLMHAYLYIPSPLINERLSHCLGSNGDMLQSAPWVCVNTLVAIYNMGSGLLPREMLLKRFVDITSDSFCFPFFVFLTTGLS